MFYFLRRLYSANKKHQQGFSLSELLIVLAILSCLATLATAQWKFFYSTRQQIYIISSLQRSIDFAREQAVLRYQPIIISPRERRDWQSGWIIQMPNNNHVLRIFPLMPLAITLSKFGASSSELKINADGLLEGNNGSFTCGKIKLIFNRGGRTRIEYVK